TLAEDRGGEDEQGQAGTEENVPLRPPALHFRPVLLRLPVVALGAQQAVGARLPFHFCTQYGGVHDARGHGAVAAVAEGDEVSQVNEGSGLVAGGSIGLVELFLIVL